MTTYRATLELKTPFWWKVLRFFRLKAKREEFGMTFKKDWFRTGDIVNNGYCDIKIIGRNK